jgi:hypothetical protein
MKEVKELARTNNERDTVLPLSPVNPSVRIYCSSVLINFVKSSLDNTYIIRINNFFKLLHSPLKTIGTASRNQTHYNRFQDIKNIIRSCGRYRRLEQVGR